MKVSRREVSSLARDGRIHDRGAAMRLGIFAVAGLLVGAVFLGFVEGPREQLIFLGSALVLVVLAPALALVLEAPWRRRRG